MNQLQVIAQPRKKALRYLGVFFVAIILLTLLSTTLHTLSVAQVETAKPQRMALTRTLEANGIVKAEVESPFFVDNLYVGLGIFVDQVMVYDGQWIDIGDPIIKLNTEQLERALGQAEIELAKQQLLSEKSNITANAKPNTPLDEQKAERDAKAAARNRENTLASADQTISMAEEALAEAQIALNKALENKTKTQSQLTAEAHANYLQNLQNAQDTVTHAELAVQQATAAKSNALLMAQRHIEDCQRTADSAQAALALSPDDAALQMALVSAQIARTRAEEDYSLAERNGDSNISVAASSLDKARQEMNILAGQGVTNMQQTSVDAAQSAIEQAQKAVVDRQRDVNDAKKAKDHTIAKANDEIWLEEYNRKIMQEEKRIQTEQEEISEKQSMINRQLQNLEQLGYQSKVKLLRQIVEADGIVHATYSGIVTKIAAQGGSPVPTVAVRISQVGAGLSFICRAQKLQAKYFMAGDPVLLKTQEQQDIEAPIQEIRAVMEDDELVDIVIRLDAEQMQIGASASLKAEKKTSVYDCVLPLEALHWDSSGYFVMVVREKKDGWGAKLYAERARVNVLAQDYINAAVEGPLQFNDTCITRSNKAINNGDSVQGVRQ